jgi:hypothetical protein
MNFIFSKYQIEYFLYDSKISSNLTSKSLYNLIVLLFSSISYLILLPFDLYVLIKIFLLISIYIYNYE